MENPILERNVRPLWIAMRQRDQHTYDHGRRVEELAVALARKCAIPEKDIRLLCIAAAFHDIGKIGIPDSILLKEGKLNNDEWVIMKSHAQSSYDIMCAVDCEGSEVIAKAILHHHERFDGHGYPYALAGEDIPVLARILSIVDTYDSMARKRVYAAAKPHSQIMDELLQERGLQHDPYLAAKFMELMNSDEGLRFRTDDK